MTNPLHGCLLKIKRAEQHMGTLDTHVRGFLDEDPYTVGFKPYRQHAEQLRIPPAEISVWGDADPSDLPIDSDGLFHFDGEVVDETGIVLNVVKNEPVVWWAILIGDVIHNLRSSLDHMVYALTMHASGPPPPDPVPHKSPWRRVRFPITLDEINWNDACSSLMGAPWNLINRFYDLQPFRYREHCLDPRTHPLAVLDALWIRDKHRTLNLTRTLVSLDVVASDPPQEGLAKLDAKIIERRDLGPFKDGDEVARLEIISPAMNVEALPYTLNRNLKFAFDIAFDQGSPAEGMRMMQVLKGLLDIVTAILIDFQSTVA